MRNKPYLLPAALLSLVSACSRAPSVDILGSFFPAWIICCALGIALSVLTYFLFTRIDLEAAIPVPVLTYPCLAASYTFLVWLIFYR